MSSRNDLGILLSYKNIVSPRTRHDGFNPPRSPGFQTPVLKAETEGKNMRQKYEGELLEL
jgi:hypothetical protein